MFEIILPNGHKIYTNLIIKHRSSTKIFTIK